MFPPTVYFGDLLAALDRMGLAGRLADEQQAVAAAEKVREVATAFGMEWQIPQMTEARREDSQPPKNEERETGTEEPVVLTETASGPERLEFWAVLGKRMRPAGEVNQPPEELRNVPPPSPDKWTLRGGPRRGAPLMAWSRLWPFLRRVLGHKRPSRSPDLARLVRALALGRPLHRLPRQQRSAWCPEVMILVDRRPAMSPFLDDFDDIIARIRTLRGSAGLRVVSARADHCGLLSDTTLDPLPLPRNVNCTAMLAVGDLGQYAGGLAAVAWTSWGRKARALGFIPWALCPCPQDRWIPSVVQTWKTVCWDRYSRPPLDGSGHRAMPWAEDEREAAVKRRGGQLHDLLRLVSPAIRVERGFLRDVRFLLDHSAADAGTEYDAFQSADAVGQGEGLSLTPARQRELRTELGQTAEPSLLAEMLQLLRLHHAYSATIFGAEELDGLMECLPAALRPLLKQSGLLTPETEADRTMHWRQIAAGLLEGRFGRQQEAMKSYAMRGISRVEGTIADSAAKQVIWVLNHHDHEGDFPEYVSPDTVAYLQKESANSAKLTLSMVEGLRLGALSPNDKLPLGTVFSRWRAASVQVEYEDGAPSRKLRWMWQNAPLFSEAELRRIKRIHIDAGLEGVELGKFTRPLWAKRMWYEGEGLRAEFEGMEHPFAWTMGGKELWPADVGPTQELGYWNPTGPPPSWATHTWVDNFGLAAEFRIRGVSFVLRWIPPGSFLMGSPEGEPSRYSDEGPQHEVQITRGFWMGETPVTQAQWRAVVEEATAKKGLMERLLRKKDRLNPVPSHFKGPAELPVENVSWEDSATFCGALDALLPEGPGFRLPTEAQWEYACRAGMQSAYSDGSPCTQPEGEDPALNKLGWYAKNSGSETHEVRQKGGNGWGLYDTHGNVWEWCRDAWDAEAYQKRGNGVKDPESRSEDDSASRVVRGGSWGSQALLCRAAIRGWSRPGGRDLGVGLRLSAGQEPGAAEPQKRSGATSRRGGAVPGGPPAKRPRSG